MLKALQVTIFIAAVWCFLTELNCVPVLLRQEKEAAAEEEAGHQERRRRQGGGGGLQDRPVDPARADQAAGVV